MQMQTQEPFKKYASDTEVPRIAVADAKKEVDAGTAVIVDSRAEAAYKAEHIAGSINVADESKFDTLPKGKKLIVYCS
jgi:rhodanese-related sulfurtransferase